MSKNLTNYLSSIFRIISNNSSLEFSHPHLPHFSENEIQSPIGNILPLLLAQTSKLPNKVVDSTLLENLIIILNQNKALVRLNHVGFCYKVTSQEKEKERFVNLLKQTELHLYEEQSNDDGLWLFIGDVDKWEEPLMELVPIESTNDSEADYWFPHIQIDVDTQLTGEEIKRVITTVFTNIISPYPIIIEGTTYIIRNRLGIVDGVNIFLDLATNSRNVKYSRQQLWKKLV